MKAAQKLLEQASTAGQDAYIKVCVQNSRRHGDLLLYMSLMGRIQTALTPPGSVMNDYEGALLSALVDTIKATAAGCRAQGTETHTARAVGLDAAADVLEDCIGRLAVDEQTLALNIAAKLAALEALLLWASKTGRGVVPGRKGEAATLAAVGAPGFIIGHGDCYGAAALDLVTLLGLAHPP